MVVVEPVVSMEKLLSLLGEQTEAPGLDYKSELDLGCSKAVVELAKDVAAMLFDGGFIVVGVSNRGEPTGHVVDDQLPGFDESRLRARLRKWIPEPFELLSASHNVEGKNVVVIYVGPHKDGLAVLRADGAYADDRGKQELVFRKGDVFVRHGTASERWEQHDVDRFRTRVRAKEREAVLREIAPLVDRVTEGARALRVVEGPIETFDWQLDQATFRAAVLEVLRRNDHVALRSMLLHARDDAVSMNRSDSDLDRFRVLVNRVASVVATGVEFHDELATNLGIVTLVEIYNRQPRSSNSWTDGDHGTLQRWLVLLSAVEALGGKAVRERDWHAVRLLTLQKPQGTSDRYSSWMRHALTVAARAGLLPETRTDGSVIELGRAFAVANPDLIRDVADDEDRLLSSICQFDFLASVAILAHDQNASFYPSFARFYGRRTIPVVEELLSDDDLRGSIAPVDDLELAGILRIVDRVAQKESFRFAGWDGYESNLVQRFLAENPDRISD